MKIDSTVEDSLRNAFAAVVDKEPDKIEPALRGLDEEQSRVGVAYAAFVVGYVLTDVLREDLSVEGANVLAEDVRNDLIEWIDLEDWGSVGPFMYACAQGDTNFPGTDPKNVVLFAIVLGGYLLSRYRHKDQRWFEYLDEIWNAAESERPEA